jgi:hypothetical protein
VEALAHKGLVFTEQQSNHFISLFSDASAPAALRPYVILPFFLKLGDEKCAIFRLPILKKMVKKSF